MLGKGSSRLWAASGPKLLRLVRPATVSVISTPTRRVGGVGSVTVTPKRAPPRNALLPELLWLRDWELPGSRSDSEKSPRLVRMTLPEAVSSHSGSSFCTSGGVSGARGSSLSGIQG